jgi:porphobilinogen deaminase
MGEASSSRSEPSSSGSKNQTDRSFKLRYGAMSAAISDAEHLQWQFEAAGIPATSVWLDLGNRKHPTVARAQNALEYEKAVHAVFADALLKGEIDLACFAHDRLPTRQEDGIILGAVSERKQLTDTLILHDKSVDRNMPYGLPANARLDVNSRAQWMQWNAVRPDLQIRLADSKSWEAVQMGSVDAVVLPTKAIAEFNNVPNDFVKSISAVGVDAPRHFISDPELRKGAQQYREDLAHSEHMPGKDGEEAEELWYQYGHLESWCTLEYLHLPPEMFIPAPAQGVRAYLWRKGDQRTSAAMALLHHPETVLTLRAERKLQASIQGGRAMDLDHMAFAAYCREEEGLFHFHIALGQPLNANAVDVPVSFPRRIWLKHFDPEVLVVEAWHKLHAPAPERVFLSRKETPDGIFARAMQAHSITLQAAPLSGAAELDVPSPERAILTDAQQAEAYLIRYPERTQDVLIAVGEDTLKALRRLGAGRVFAARAADPMALVEAVFSS